MWAIVLLYKDEVTKKRRTEVKLFASKPEFALWVDRVETNWNSVMNDSVDPATGHPMTVTATLYQGPIEWSFFAFVPSAAKWTPVAEVPTKKKGKKAA